MLTESFGLLAPKRFLAAFIVEQGLFKLRQNVIWDVDRLQHLDRGVRPSLLSWKEGRSHFPL